eukprot:728592-Lingulodinium_polyedra.AAC.2
MFGPLDRNAWAFAWADRMVSCWPCSPWGLGFWIKDQEAVWVLCFKTPVPMAQYVMTKARRWYTRSQCCQQWLQLYQRHRATEGPV